MFTSQREKNRKPTFKSLRTVKQPDSVQSKKLSSSQKPHTGINEVSAAHIKPVNRQEDAIDFRVAQLADPTNELLSYYRRKVETLTEDHELVHRRLDQISDVMGNRDRLDWEIRQREDEISELQKTLSDMQVYLFQEREHVLRLYAENDRLKIRESDDRRKIQHLLQLSGLGPAEITYFLRDTAISVNQTRPKDEEHLDDDVRITGDSKNRCISGLVIAPIVPTAPAQGVVELTASGKTIRRPANNALGQTESLAQRGNQSAQSTTVSRLEFEAAVLETERTKASLRALRTQLTEQTRAAREQIDSLMDDRRTIGDEADILCKRYREKLKLSEEQLKRCQALLYDSTKDLLAQRKQFRQAEKVWITEKDKLLSQLEAKRVALVATTPMAANGLHHSNGYMPLDRNISHTDGLQSRAWSEVANQLVEKRQSQLTQTISNLEHQLDQQQKLSDMYREQVIQLEEELVRCREEDVMSKDVFKDHSGKLNQRLQTMTNRYRDLERRRQLEMQGYRTDIATLRKKLREVEKQLLKLSLGFADGAELPDRPQDVDLAILEQVKSSTVKSTQLMNQLKSLKLKMYTLEDDLRRI